MGVDWRRRNARQRGRWASRTTEWIRGQNEPFWVTNAGLLLVEKQSKLGWWWRYLVLNCRWNLSLLIWLRFSRIIGCFDCWRKLKKIDLIRVWVCFGSWLYAKRFRAQTGRYYAFWARIHLFGFLDTKLLSVWTVLFKRGPRIWFKRLESQTIRTEVTGPWFAEGSRSILSY